MIEEKIYMWKPKSNDQGQPAQSLQADLYRYFLWHFSKTMQLWVQYGMLKIIYRILCKTEESRPC